MARPTAHDPRRLLDPAHLGDPAEVRPAGGTVLDLHAHSAPISRDSGVSAERLVAQAARRGLDGVVLTEHNAIWSAEAARELSERHEVCVLPGMEIGTDVGHVLVYGLDRFTPELLEIVTLRRVAEAEGAMLALAHPMRPFHGRHAPRDRYVEWFDALEAVNGDHADTEGGPFELLAGRIGVGAIGGSDVHSEQAVGRVVTAFDSTVEDIGDLVDHIRTRLTHARDLRPRASSGTGAPQI